MISGEEGREARGNKESFKKYDKPKIVGSATLEIHYVMLVATLIFKQFKLFFNSIFRIYELVDFEQQWLLFSSFGQFSGECGWGQFSLVAVLACYIAWLECQSVSQSLRWKGRHCYHHKERPIHLWRIYGYSLGYKKNNSLILSSLFTAM